MTRVRAWFKAVALFSRHAPPLPRHAPEWTDEDAQQLSGFLGSATGRKLDALILIQQANQNASAVQRGQPWACGFATGWRACVAWLIGLSADSRPQQGTGETVRDEGAADLLERLAP